jgi:putative membrane protein
MRFLIDLLVTAIAVFILSKLLEPHVVINSFSTALIFALVLAFLNSIVKPLLIILTLPLTIVTLGIFLLVINVLIILFADNLVSGINIEGLFWAFIFGLLLSLLSSFLQNLTKKKEE